MQDNQDVIWTNLLNLEFSVSDAILGGHGTTRTLQLTVIDLSTLCEEML